MNSSNIKRYGGVTVFIVAVVICALFFVQVLALMQGYSDNISDQAVERARFLTGKQAEIERLVAEEVARLAAQNNAPKCAEIDNDTATENNDVVSENADTKSDEPTDEQPTTNSDNN